MNENSYVTGQWAIVELMGRRFYAGFVTERNGVWECAIPDGPQITFGAGAIYLITPCSEQQARANAGRMMVATMPLLPIQVEMAQALPDVTAVDDEPGDDEPDIDDDYEDDELAEVEEVPPPDLVDDARARRDAILFARALMEDPSRFVILDTETTGINLSRDVPVEIAVIDGHGWVQLDTLVQPGDVPVSQRARDVHGITDEELALAPTADELREQLTAAITGKIVVTYNAEYDYAMIRNMFGEAIFLDRSNLRFNCAMNQYAAYHGEWNDYHQSYKWQSLENACKQLGVPDDELVGKVPSKGSHVFSVVSKGAHCALGDCLRTLAVIRKMAETKLPEEEPGYIPF